MSISRRGFLISAGVGVNSLANLARAQEPQPVVKPYPDGVIDPFQWGDRPIPMAETGPASTKVVDDAVTAAMRQYGVMGCGISVVRDHSVVYSNGFGYAEAPAKLFTANTTSRCGSLAKPVTALSALILLDQGKLDLDANVLPLLKKAGIDPRPVGESTFDRRTSAITVRHLMDHTSGLPRSATYTAWRADRNVAALHGLRHVATSHDVVSDALGNTTLDSEPGAQFQYANANFVILARIIEVCSGMPFHRFLTHVSMPAFGLKADEIYVSRNQVVADSPRRGKNEADYFQTSADRFVSFVPAEQAKGPVFGEAYRGYATESSDGAGGIACTAPGLGKILANLRASRPALSDRAMAEILTPPSHYSGEPGFDPSKSSYYSKGFDVRFSGGRPWFAHGGMTLHCGGVIGHNAGYQFTAVSNWNNAQGPFVDSILGHALGESVGKIGH